MIDRDFLVGWFDGRIRLEIRHGMREGRRNRQSGNVLVVLHVILRSMCKHDVGSHLVKDCGKLAQMPYVIENFQVVGKAGMPCRAK